MDKNRFRWCWCGWSVKVHSKCSNWWRTVRQRYHEYHLLITWSSVQPSLVPRLASGSSSQISQCSATGPHWGTYDSRLPLLCTVAESWQRPCWSRNSIVFPLYSTCVCMPKHTVVTYNLLVATGHFKPIFFAFRTWNNCLKCTAVPVCRNEISHARSTFLYDNEVKLVLRNGDGFVVA